MCMIITAPKPMGIMPRISEEDFRDMWQSNNHGTGFMYPEDGEVQVLKGVADFDTVWKVYLKVADYEGLVVHFRLATHGAREAANAHPFEVHKSHGGLWLMHNGVMGSDIVKCDTDTTKSDSFHFARMLREEYEAERNHLWVMSNPKFHDDVEKWIGRSNKIVLLDGDGRRVIWNESSGTIRDGVWYSNTYAAKFMKPVGWTRWMNASKHWWNDSDDFPLMGTPRATHLGAVLFQNDESTVIDDDPWRCDCGATPTMECKSCGAPLCRDCTTYGMCFDCLEEATIPRELNFTTK